MLLGYLEEYEVKSSFAPFEKLANKIEEVESDIRVASFSGDTKRTMQKNEELTLLRQEVKLIKKRNRISCF